MNIEELIKSAAKLNKIKTPALNEFIKKRELILAEGNRLMSEKEDLVSLIGENNLDVMIDNNSNHIRFMISIFTHHEPRKFVETILWVFRTYRSRGFNLLYWSEQLKVWQDVLKKHLSEDTLLMVMPYYDWMIENIDEFSELSAQPS